MDMLDLFKSMLFLGHLVDNSELKFRRGEKSPLSTDGVNGTERNALLSSGLPGSFGKVYR